MNTYEAYSHLSPEQRGEVIVLLGTMIRPDYEDAEFPEIEPAEPERRIGSTIVHAVGKVLEILFRALVNGVYLLTNLVMLGIAGTALSELAEPGLADYFLYVVLPVMLIAWFFYAFISLLGGLGYANGRTKFGMIRLVSKISTWITVAATIVVAVVWIISRLIEGKRKDGG